MPTATLRVSAGPSSGRSIACHRGRYALGRATTSALRIEDSGVQWEHCIIDADENNLWIENRAASGTTLAGKTLRARARLHHGDVIRLSPRSEVIVVAPHLRRSRMPVVLAVLAGLSVCAGAWWFMSRPKHDAEPSAYQVRSALVALSTRLADPKRTERAMEGLASTLHNACRLEAAGDAPAARRLFHDAWVAASAHLSPKRALSLREAVSFLNSPNSAVRSTNDHLLAAAAALAHDRYTQLTPPPKSKTSRFKP